MANLTDLEKKVLYQIVNNEYAEGDIDTVTWTFAAIEDSSDKGAFGSLVKKGLVSSSGQVGSDNSDCSLTDAGKDAYRSCFPLAV